jgi:hypothetical protein
VKGLDKGLGVTHLARGALDELLSRCSHVEVGAVERLNSGVFPGIVSMKTVLHN